MTQSKSGITPTPVKVGYRSPPMEFCWSKGTSGNAKGRKKGSKNIATVVREQAKKTVIFVDKNGKKRKLTDLQAQVETCSQRGLKGDNKAQAEILKLYSTHLPTEDAIESAEPS